MNQFKIFSSKRKEGYIKINEVDKGSIIQVKIEELKIGVNIIQENTIATIAYMNSIKYPLLQFKDGKLLKLSNQKLIDWIWEQNGYDRYSCLYKYTTEHKNNWED